MKKIFVLFLISLGCIYTGFTQGIKFEQAEWSKLLEKAKKENKLIFMDCYTSWCGPCKRLASEVFTQKEVGQFFNGHFINTKYDMEVDPLESAKPAGKSVGYSLLQQVCQFFATDFIRTCFTVFCSIVCPESC